MVTSKRDKGRASCAGWIGNVCSGLSLYTVYDGGGGNGADGGGLKMKQMHPGNAGLGWRREDLRRDAGGIAGDEGEKEKSGAGT